MKALLASGIVFAALLLTACGGAGHSDSYNKGFTWANDSSLARQQASLVGTATVCGGWATNQAQGLNQQEWIQGCTDALVKAKG